MKFMVDKSYKEKAFHCSLVTLAQKSDEQIKSTEPGCVMCELIFDFNDASDSYLEEFDESLNEEQKGAIQKIQKIIDALPQYECFDNSVLEGKEWETLRKVSENALKLFGWSLVELPKYHQDEKGIFRKQNLE
jgi:hypothetical protein